MVERKTNEMLRKLDADYVHRSPSPSFREIETPSVLREVDAYIGSKEQTEIPASSLDAVLAEDSDLNPPTDSKEENDSADEPLVSMTPQEEKDENPKKEEEVSQDVKDVSIVDVADDSSDVPLASFVNKEEESSSSDGTLLGDLLSKSVMESLERVNAKRKQLETQKEESDLEEVTVEDSSEEKPIADGIEVINDQVTSDSTMEDGVSDVPIVEKSEVKSSVNEKSVVEASVSRQSMVETSLNEKSVMEESMDEKSVIEALVNEKPVSEAPINEIPTPIHVKENTFFSESIHYGTPSSDTSSDDDKPIGELIAAQYTSKEDMMKSKPNPSPQKTKQEEENLSHGEAVQYLESPVSEPKGEKAKTVFPRHQEQAVQQTKESVPHPNEELHGSTVKDTSMSTSTGSSIPVVVSSFSALESQPNMQSLNVSPSVKPPPLSHDAIDRLFPRLPLVSNPSTTKEKPVSLQGVVCPLCLTMSNLDRK